MAYFLGVDGGGSNLRVAVVDVNLSVLGEYETTTANPGVIGHDAARDHIQSAIRRAVAQVGLDMQQITAVGVGIAGASAEHSAAWVQQTIGTALPDSLIVLSSDYEIALVGALGERRGVLILAGTGSIAYGVNAFEESCRVGGWGYLMGDEGSGYAIGMQALRAIVRYADGRSLQPLTLTATILSALALEQPLDLIGWLHGDIPRTRDVARLAPLVLEAAVSGDPVADRIAEDAAQELALMVRAVVRKLNMQNPQIAFAGGLLAESNTLSLRLCELLGLEAIPQSKYPPVIGAALLAKIQCEDSC